VEQVFSKLQYKRQFGMGNTQLLFLSFAAEFLKAQGLLIVGLYFNLQCHVDE